MTEKLYTIRHVAKQLEVTSKTIKNWEKDGDIPLPRRDRNNVRVYNQEEIERIRRIKRIGEITSPVVPSGWQGNAPEGEDALLKQDQETSSEV